MKFVLKNLLIFVIVTVILFFSFTTKTFYSYCKENQLKIFCSNGYGGIEAETREKIDEFKIRGLGAAILSTSSLVENDSNDTYDTNGYALWMQMQIGVFEITQYYMLSIFLGLAITYGYNITLSKKMNKILKIILGYIIPIIIMPILYYLVRTINERTFVELNKIVYFCIIYTVIFLAMNITNYMIKKDIIHQK